MIGMWQRFGQGEPPRDGEALVFIRTYNGDIIDALEGRTAEAVIAIYRFGSLHEQTGSIYSVPHGLLWTSLPPPEAEA